MSYFRNFGNVVNSQILSKPHNLLFRSNTLPRLLCQSNQPCIQHLHTSKYLIKTIYALKQLQNSSSKEYYKIIESELNYLQNCKRQYQIFAKRYIQSQGKLTAEAIANAYAVAQQFNISSEWLDKNVHQFIPNKARYMSQSNLTDLIEGLKRHHPNSPYLQQLQKKKAQQQFTQFDYADRLSNQVTRFQYCGNSSSSNHLISSLHSGRSYQIYWFGKQACFVWSRIAQFFGRPSSYRLHDE